jgi:hypothetical protein
VLPRRPGPLGSALDITTILMNVSLGLAQMLMLTYRGQDSWSSKMARALNKRYARSLSCQLTGQAEVSRMVSHGFPATQAKEAGLRGTWPSENRGLSGEKPGCEVWPHRDSGRWTLPEGPTEGHGTRVLSP